MLLNKRPWYLFWINKTFWVTISPNIYYPNTVDSSKLCVSYKHLIAHENVHLKQQKNNKFIWFLKYIFSSSFRLKMEVEAMGMEAYIAEKYYGLTYASDCLLINAGNLSSHFYFWCASYSEAKNLIEQHWNYLKQNPSTEDPFNGMCK